MQTAATYCVGWAALFYASLAIAVVLQRILPPSSVAAENRLIWVAWNLYTCVQSLCIPAICLRSLFSNSDGEGGVWWRSPRDQFANQNDVASAGLLLAEAVVRRSAASSRSTEAAGVASSTCSPVGGLLSRHAGPEEQVVPEVGVQ